MTCVSSNNVICKHVGATRWFYVDLDFMPAGVTVVSADASSEDITLTVGEPEIIDTNTIVDADADCGPITLVADRALAIQIGDGTSDEDNEVLVSVTWVQSDGDEDGRYLRLIVR
jgi:hypothetical protein